MARKRKKKPVRKPRGPRLVYPTRYDDGAAVRVRAGVAHPEFADFPIGGWAGEIVDVDPHHNPPLYLVEWDDATLDQVHPVYYTRCERDGGDPESMWLDETDLEPDPGESVAIEQPTTLVIRPLDPALQDDRLRAILGVTTDDPVPGASLENLHRYHEYLTAHLALPFRGEAEQEIGPFESRTHRVTVLALRPAGEIDEDGGILCEVEERGERMELPLAVIAAKGGGRNRELVEDYDYWFGNFPPDDDEDEDAPSRAEPGWLGPPPGELSLPGMLFRVVLYGSLYGAVLGLLAGAGGWWVWTGAGLGAVLGALVQGRSGARVARMALGSDQRLRPLLLLGTASEAMLGALVGGMLGAVLAILIPAWPGTLLGLLGGVLLGLILARLRPRPMSLIFTGLLGAVLGAVGLAVARNPSPAGAGLLWGIVAGLGGACAVFLASGVVALLMMRNSRKG